MVNNKIIYLLEKQLKKKNIQFSKLLFTNTNENLDEYLNRFVEKENKKNCDEIRNYFESNILTQFSEIIKNINIDNTYIYVYILNTYYERIEELIDKRLCYCNEKNLIIKSILENIINQMNYVSQRVLMKYDYEMNLDQIKWLYKNYPGLVFSWKNIIENEIAKINIIFDAFDKDHKEINSIVDVKEGIYRIERKDSKNYILEVLNNKIIFSFTDKYYKFNKLFEKIKDIDNDFYNLIDYNGILFGETYAWILEKEKNYYLQEDVNQFEMLGKIVCIMYGMNFSSKFEHCVHTDNKKIYIDNIEKVFSNGEIEYSSLEKYLYNSVNIYNLFDKKYDIYAKYIVKGFKKMYFWIKDNKKYFISLVNNIFKDTDVMSIMDRKKIEYISIHPMIIKNKVIREVYLLSSFYKDNIEIANKCMKSIMNNEEIELKFQGNIQKNFIDKINSFSEYDFYKQINIINGKCTFVSRINSIGDSIFYEKKCNIEDVLDYLVSEVMNKAILCDNNYFWIDTIGDIKGNIYVEDICHGLYEGVPGIILAIYYASMLNENKYDNLLKKLNMYIYNIVKKYIEENSISGVFDGVSGYIYVILRCKDLLDKDKKNALIVDYLNILNKSYTNIEAGDFISGLVGILPILDIICCQYNDKLDIYNLSKELILKIVDKIIEDRIYCEKYGTYYFGERGYTGYAHGSSGVCSQLVRVKKYIDDNRIDNVIFNLLEYEKKMFDCEQKNWKKSIKDNYCNCAWCHGAPGILLSRLSLVQNGIRNKSIYEDINIAIETIKKYENGYDMCLCHGDFGNLIILKKAAKLLKNEELLDYVNRSVKRIISKIMTEGTRLHKEINKTENVSLMCGISSLIYGIVKIYDDSVPDVLCLE